MDKRQQENLYQKLARISAKLLDSKEYLNGEMEKVRDAFFDNFRRILQTAFDVSLDVEELKKFLEQKNKQLGNSEVAYFVGNTIENPKAYEIVNYYLAGFILSYIEAVAEEKKDELWNFLKREGLTSEDLQILAANYRKLRS